MGSVDAQELVVGFCFVLIVSWVECEELLWVLLCPAALYYLVPKVPHLVGTWLLDLAQFG